MKLFLDSANTDEIAFALETWAIDGLTTNPRHVLASGKSKLAVLEEIARLLAGTDKPASVEVNPHLTDWTRIVDEAQRVAEISPNFVIKVGASEQGFQAVRELTRRGIRTNVTLVFSVAQAWHAARSGATYVSPFIGWREAHGDDGLLLVQNIAVLLSRYAYPTQIIAAAVRNARHIESAALAGAHCVTAAAAVYKDSFQHPFTDYGHRLFGAAWDETPDE